MATVKKVDLSTFFVTRENVPDKPPLPQRPSSGKFHNRGSGKLFPSTFHNKLFTNKKPSVSERNNHSQQTQNTDFSLALEIHPDFIPKDEETHTSTPKHVPSYCRRTQSAKARSRTRADSAISKPSRPQSAGVNNSKDGQKVPVINLANRIIPDLFEIEKGKILALPDSRCHQNGLNEFRPMHFSQPVPDNFYTDGSEAYKQDSVPQTDLKPSIYGLNRQRHYYGSTPNLSSINDDPNSFLYKLNDEINEQVLTIQPTNKSTLPATLEPLLPWLQTDIAEDVIGINTANCLVYLSDTTWSDLPEVTDPIADEHQADLPFVKDVTTPKPWNPKKYPYYNGKTQVVDWVCKHGASTPVDGNQVENHTIYRQTFKLPRMRTADVVRKEIDDLENLLKGIGTSDSNCSMVKYQSEITYFKHMLQDTLEMVPERLKAPPEDPPDPFGLNKAMVDHDRIIEKIVERVQECRAELADLELEAGIEIARRHFTRANSIT